MATNEDNKNNHQELKKPQAIMDEFDQTNQIDINNDNNKNNNNNNESFNDSNQTEINLDLIKNAQLSGRSFITNPSKFNQMEKTDNKINNLIQDMRKPQPK